ncbi:MAG: helix-turn-helix transcriptional regulator [Cyclobacteriaceae bacterium]
MYSRELLKGILKPIILKLLSDNSRMYGYEIVQKVKELSNHKILIKEGSLYPALHSLTKEGYLQTESVMIGNRTRKYYKLSSSGKGQVSPALDELLDFAQTLKTLFEPKPTIA